MKTFLTILILLVASSAWSAQFARPDSDVALNGWTVSGGGSLYLAIDETSPSDADFIDELSPPGPNFTVAYQMTLSNVTDPVSNSNHIIRYRGRRDQADIPLMLQIELRQGTTLIAQFQDNNIANSFTTFTHTLSAGQADNITDYNNLRFYIYAADTDEDGGVDAEVSWAEFEVPNAPAAGDDQPRRRRVLSK